MADFTEKQEKGAESPTTAHTLDFDDDQQETGIIQNNTSIPDETSDRRTSRSQSRVRFADGGDETPPAKPPRPISPNVQAENTLIEAFPDIDHKVIKAVLAASGGQVEPAFNALLGMSDPEAVQEAPPPPKPPRPTAQQRQLEMDEQYARQLAEQDRSYGGNQAPYGQRQGSYGQGQYGARQSQPYSRSGSQRMQPDEKEHSFFDDDLPEIQKNLRDGFVQTQTKFNKWISDIRKNFDGSDEDEPVAGQGTAGRRQDFGSSQADQLRGIERQADTNRARRSQDQHRYDPDPQVMSGDFDQLELRDDEDVPPPKPARPQANPNLFKPTPQPPQSGPVDEVDALYEKPIGNRRASPSAAKTSKKWQPLTSVQPDPDAEENDPFAVGDSDEEEKKKTDIRAEDTERLKRSASMADGSKGGGGEGSGLTLEPSGKGAS